jgi:hypothetical protein
VLGAGSVLLRGGEEPNRVYGHHRLLPTRSGAAVLVQAVQQNGGQRFPHANVLNGDHLEPMPHMLGDFWRGRQHLIGGEYCVVDIAAPDVFLKHRYQLINRDTVRRCEPCVRIFGVRRRPHAVF